MDHTDPWDLIRRMNRIVGWQTGRNADGTPMVIHLGDVPSPARGHPLTCGNDSTHGLLMPMQIGYGVKLVCPDCDYTQDWSPI